MVSNLFEIYETILIGEAFLPLYIAHWEPDNGVLGDFYDDRIAFEK